MSEMSRTGVRRHILVIALTVLMAPLAFLGTVLPSVALAAPKGIFSVFAQCPTSIPGVRLCQYAELTSGELVIGSMRIPIDKTIVLQGGAVPTGSPNPNEHFLLPAINGESISPTELNVPGGLRSILNCRDVKSKDLFRAHARDACRGFSHGRANEVDAILETVASPSNPAILNLAALFLEEGTGLTFPARLHLENPLLGEACYLGSQAHPIELRLTTGTTSPPLPNKPISGQLGTAFEEEEEGQELLVNTEDSLVDNAFSVPPAEGCGGHLSSLINPLVNQTLDLESTPGHNTAILNGTHRIATAAAVLASEKFPTKEDTPTPPPHHHHHWWQAH